DDAGADTAVGDSTPPVDSGSDTSDTCTLSGAAAPSTVWAGGFGTTLTATGSLTSTGTITYAWSVVTKPGGSTATISGTSASTSFVPDLPGAYTLRVTASAACTSSKTADINITAVDAPVFYESLADLSTARLGATTLRIAGAVADPPVSGSPTYPAYIN